MTNQEAIDYAKSQLPDDVEVRIERDASGCDEMTLERRTTARIGDVGTARADEGVKRDIDAAVEAFSSLVSPLKERKAKAG